MATVTNIGEYKYRRELRETTHSGPEPMADVVPKQRILGIDENLEIELPGRISTHDFYVDAEESSKLSIALELLDRASTILDRAMAEYKANQHIAADDHVQHFQAMLPELFCLRTIGDGFGATINALWFSLVNLEGIPPSIEQISALGTAVSRVRAGPMLSFDASVDINMTLEDAGLLIDPMAIQNLSDRLDDEGIS